jgi:hypothetical protein
MREPTSGTDIPHATYTWAIADQGVAAATGFTPAAVVVPGAQVGNGTVVVTARAALPAVAVTFTQPHINAWISAADAVTITISNPAAAALAPTAADIILDIQVMPVIP